MSDIKTVHPNTGNTSIGTRKWVSVPKTPPDDAPAYDIPMPGESDKEFRNFQVWLQLEEQDRSLKAVSMETHVSRTRLSVYAKKNRWGDRASKFDQERRQQRFAKRNATILSARDKVAQIVNSRLDTMSPEELTASETLGYLQLVDKLDRLDADVTSDMSRADFQGFKQVSIEVFQFLLDGVSDEFAERARPLLVKFEKLYGISDEDPGD